MEGGVAKRKRDEEPGNRSFSAASDSERTAENAKESGKSAYRGVQYDTKNNRWRYDRFGMLCSDLIRQ